jgi:hypothetical protein
MATNLTALFEAFSPEESILSPYSKLTEVELTSLIHGLPVYKLPVDEFTKAGWMEFCGNQWNEDWRWSSMWIEELRRSNRLAIFYIYVKGHIKT